ncbi:vomeronasal type-2 receptor 26-like [Dendropsophus ebraccatus]|uniref:vomeronasal type-2 receptor 26-like n=1 Tax=Dendropsophus ebraccatus TaxID=150705 RepID=UPI003830FF2A
MDTEILLLLVSGGATKTAFSVQKETLLISYGATDKILINKKIYPSFFQTLPNDRTQYLAIVKLLIYFGWTWFGVIASDDNGGHRQSQELKTIAELHNICAEFIINIRSDDIEGKPIISEKDKIIFNRSTSKILVLCGTVSLHTIHYIESESSGGHEKTLILPAGPSLQVLLSSKYKKNLHGSLVFSPSIIKIPRMSKFLEDVSPANRPNDFLLEHILATYLNCLTSNAVLNTLHEGSVRSKLYNCSKTIKLVRVGYNTYYTKSFEITYLIYKSVYAMANAVHEMQIHLLRNHDGSIKNYKHMLKYFLRKIYFQDPLGEFVYFNEKGEMTTNYIIRMFGSLNNTQLDTYFLKTFGKFNESSKDEEQLVIQQIPKLWKHGKIPVSRCSEDCPPGSRRVIKSGTHKCCFECIKCSRGEISNGTDTITCQRCPEDQWPNDMNQCVPKLIDVLSYEGDTVVIAVTIISVFVFVKSTVILGIFIVFRDTPVVRANNQTLSYILLVSIMLSFLCVFLFLGRPTHVTCMLRQTSFGIIFSVAISSILAKTIMVYMAFKATKPGSSWRKFIGVRIPNCVVFFCSFLQVLLSIIWLSTSPPFPEQNIHLYQDKIIFQCNEGSMLAFSILLGYMGLLASISFIVAFLARNLPDSFNEAKNITFSMLVVCSVWVAFIPAYMSVTGKNTVLVEIFAIISSSVGILGCIFFPKCYIILVRPELNTKSSLSRQICNKILK